MHLAKIRKSATPGPPNKNRFKTSTICAKKKSKSTTQKPERIKGIQDKSRDEQIKSLTPQKVTPQNTTA